MSCDARMDSLLYDELHAKVVQQRIDTQEYFLTFDFQTLNLLYMISKTALVIVILFFSLACSAPKLTEAELEIIRQEVMDTDLAFSTYSNEIGFRKALVEYAADDAIKLVDDAFPIGKAQLQMDARLDTLGNSRGTLTWRPLKVHLAASGDLAAAFGDWKLLTKSPRTSNDTTLYGNYITVWKKQVDGSWKYVVDGGNPTPGPTPASLLEVVN